jgi:hypothetical protein
VQSEGGMSAGASERIGTPGTPRMSFKRAVAVSEYIAVFATAIGASERLSHPPGCDNEYWPTCADEYWPTPRCLIC